MSPGQPRGLTRADVGRLDTTHGQVVGHARDKWTDKGTYMDTDSGLDKLVDTHEAGRMAGKSPATVRRWVRQGHLKDMRAEGDKKGPVLVSVRDVRAYLAKSSVQPAQGAPGGRTGGHSRTGYVDALVDELRADKARLLAEVGNLKRQVEDLRRQVAESHEKAAALERELNGGTVRGLLKAAVARRW